MPNKQIAQNCYSMAYFILPDYVFNEKHKVIAELSTGKIGAAFFYTLTCMHSEQEPGMEIRDFDVVTGSIGDYNYYIIQYPTPPAVNVMDGSVEDMMASMKNIVLAPYFSAIIQEKQSQEMKYFILGQSPDGETTFRCVDINEQGMSNMNLGPGCEPKLEPFLAMLQNHLEK